MSEFHYRPHSSLNGFPVVYDKSVAGRLIAVLQKNSFCNAELAEIGKSVDETVVHTPFARIDSSERLIEGYKTGDGYVWFAGLKYEVCDMYAVILFPGHFDYRPDEIRTGSVAVYASGEVREEIVHGLVDRLADAAVAYRRDHPKKQNGMKKDEG